LYLVLAVILLLSAMPAQAAAGSNPFYGKLELAFERNAGQADKTVEFLSRGSRYTLFLARNEAVIGFTAPNASVVRMKLLGQNRHPSVDGLDRLPGSANYLTGSGSAQQTDIPRYRKVRYSEVYPGIDVVYHGNGQLLEYDFIVSPGSDPNRIRIGFSGVRSRSLDSAGDLVLQTESDPLLQRKPRAYQNIDGIEKNVDVAYVISRDQVRFKIGDYDRTKPLVIDPLLVYSTYFGGSGPDQGNAITVDVEGSVYVTGVTTSLDFPVASGVQMTHAGGTTDAFVFKLDPTGTQVVYSTFIGGSGNDEGHSIAVDSGGNAYITGFTNSNDFPIVNGFQKKRGGLLDAYVVKLNRAGNQILFSSYIGGSIDDRGYGIALDRANNIYITGTASSTDFPTVNAYQRNNAGGFADGFLTKIGPAGNVIYSTYVGGIGNDNPLGIAVDGNGAAYVTGFTSSPNFPLVNPFQDKFSGITPAFGTDDAFVFKMNPAGTALEYSTYVGATSSDEATRIAVDDVGSAYITGFTNSSNFPLVNPFQATIAGTVDANGVLPFDAFVTKLSPDGKSLVFSTFFGGSSTDSGTGIAVDADHNVYISGYTLSFDLPTANQIQGFIGGDRDAFLAKFDPAGNILVFSTFLGGLNADAGISLAVDNAGNAYITGFTDSVDFPNANAVQPNNQGTPDVFVAKLDSTDIVSSQQFQIAPQGASTVITKGTRTDAVFGYATAESTPGAQLTGLAIVDRKQNGASVSQVGVMAPPLLSVGRLFANVTSTGKSVLSIANPNDDDVSVDVIYTDETGNSSKFVTITVAAHQHFSHFVTDDPLDLTGPGTLNFTSSLPVAATAFFTITNESSELLLSETPIVQPVEYTDAVQDRAITIPELADGAGWNTDVVLVNTTEDRMNGEVRFVSQGSGSQPATPLELGIGDGTSTATTLEFDIPPRSFQTFTTAGSSSTPEVPFVVNSGFSSTTPGGGAFQVSGWASADATRPDAQLSGMEMLQYRQLGITQSQTGILAPPPRLSGRVFVELTDKIKSLIAIANPNDQDVSVDFSLTDDAGTSTDPVTVTIPAGGQFSNFVSESPISLPTGEARALSFSASLPVFVTALRFFTNERGDNLVSATPVADNATVATQPVVIPNFVDGFGWSSKVILVNNSEDEMRGEIRFLSQGSATDAPQGVAVGTASGTASIFEYDIVPHSFYLLETNGLMDTASMGSVYIVPFGGFNAPHAHVIIQQMAGDNTIFQYSVEGQTPATSLRFYAEAVGDFDAGTPKSTRTAITIANPSSSTATVRLDLTSFGGSLLGTSAPFQISVNGQISLFLSQVPGLTSLPVPFQGILRLNVTSGSGVTATAARIMINERSDYLTTTTGPLNENAGLPGRLIFPYMTDSTGYTTQFILINPTGVTNTSGVLHYIAADATPLQINDLKLGSIRIVPFGGFNTPHAHAILSHRDGGVLTSQTFVEGQLPQTVFRVYAESIGDFDAGIAGSTQSGVALANPSDNVTNVRLELRGLDGALIRTSRPVAVPAGGQVAMFLNQVPGFETLAPPFEGVLKVTAASPGITGTAFRAAFNERGNVLFTTTGPLSEDAGAPGLLVFPHIAEGGGYTTQFVVISGAAGHTDSGLLRFFNEQGNPLNVSLSSR
jgi:hypothetical protein